MSLKRKIEYAFNTSIVYKKSRKFLLSFKDRISKKIGGFISFIYKYLHSTSIVYKLLCKFTSFIHNFFFRETFRKTKFKFSTLKIEPDMWVWYVIAFLYKFLIVFVLVWLLILAINVFLTTDWGIGLNKITRHEFYQRIESLSILAGVIVILASSSEQRKRSNYEAWQVINSATNQRGSGGRKDALEDLNQDGVSLAGLNLKNADLIEINLKKANLVRANLQNTKLNHSNFSKANLTDAKLIESDLSDANLEQADLTNADLSRANLNNANLKNAKLISTKLSNTNLRQAYLDNAKFSNADLTNADLI